MNNKEDRKAGSRTRLFPVFLIRSNEIGQFFRTRSFASCRELSLTTNREWTLVDANPGKD